MNIGNRKKLILALAIFAVAAPFAGCKKAFDANKPQYAVSTTVQYPYYY